ncbi:MAG: efflux RND transporter permease subunit [Methylophilaceae bacterium]|jgi:hydrophobe/amphiphile efflux-1 (HAE1) family protein|uniref:efflux RND transporter permease subunit n=1 Tax=Methylobacillus sp. MM3 TaxID=1848039 RepID=UPI0007E19335|nr:multidrug efflux RND transporter permease subunit [Methylobacillus sp. MM3]OAJ70078.1 RND transporter [Methylobacillus sp. MM3]
MNFSRFFIHRPIFAAVLSIFIVLAGLAAMGSLPIAQYPEIAPPVVTVRAVYPGASAQVLEQTVAAPIEAQINGVEDMMYMSSTSSSSGVLEVQVTFNIGADADKAALNVNNRIKQVEARLPEEVRRQGVTVEKGSSSFLQVIAFYSPDGTFDDIYTSNYVTLNVLDRIKRIPGTTNVQIFGAKDYAMRIWLKPDRMTQLGVSVNEVVGAINSQNAQFAPGKIGQNPNGNDQELVYTITTQGRLADPKAFEGIIVRSRADGAEVRLKDIARIELGSKDYDFIGRVNGKPATLVGVFLQPGANALGVAEEVNKTVAEMAASFPKGLEQSVVYDTTRFVEVSIREVVKTLIEAMVLVFLVVLLFLQNLRATLIPTLAVPVSLIGTFAGLYILGYSINTLTLFGMVLSIGIVVDDAIVVLENAERLIHERDMTPAEATAEAMREVTGPVIAIVLVLISVFVPIAFIGGLAGELYRQFAITIAIAVSISGLVALTLTPALCATILRPEHKQVNAFFRKFNQFFEWMTRRYTGGVAWMLKRSIVGILLFLGMVAVTAQLWRTTPTALVPDEDQGYYIAAVFLPDGASLGRTDKVVQEVTQAIKSNPANEYSVAFTGMDFLGGSFKNSAATIFASMKPWDDRAMPSQALVGEFFGKTAGIKEALVLAFNPPAIFGLGNAGGFEVYIQNRGEGGPDKMNEVVQSFIAKASQDKSFAFVQTLWRPQTPQIFIDVDRARAAALGVNLNEAFTTLSATLGTLYINDFNKFGRTWQVLMSADSDYRHKPEDISALHVRGANNQMVPLSAFTTVKYSTGPDTLDRFNNLPAVKLMGSGAPGVSSGEALANVDRIMKEVLPPDFSYEWTGASFQEKRSSGASSMALGMAAIMVFLILSALYERWTLPFAVLLALPFGLFGALAAVWLRNLVFGALGLPIPPLANDVYFQIGLVTLLGLAAKNAILIVEFAIMKQHEDGMSAWDAVLEAARLRFRPILMTSLAFILGVLPLAISSGAGAGARQSVGTGVMGGMMAATFLAIFFVPLFYRLIARNDKKKEVHDA